MGDLLGQIRGLAYGAWAGVNKSVQLGFLFFTAAFPVSAETVTVVALGDSLTAGYGLPEGQGFVPQLQAWLDEQGADVTIVNAGVSGDTTAGGLARLDWALTPETDAMIVALGGNDLLRGLPPEASRANLDAILARVTRELELPVLLIGLEAPSNYGPAFKEAFDKMYLDLSAGYGTLHEASFLGPLVAGLTPAEARELYMQSDGIHPNQDGVAVIVKAFGPRVVDLLEKVGP